MDVTLIALIIAWVVCLLWVPFIIKANRKTHPKALFILFFAEMWERFSYYGMRTLLTLYMVKVMFEHLGSGADAKALAVYGSYTSMVYLFPILGGIVADKFFGFRRAILFGGILMSLGHFSLAIMGFVDETNQMLFFLSLALIIVGNGYFKPNISSFLGKFYDADDNLKDSAFNIFYMGINVGALLSTLTVGYIGETINWHLGFGLAGIGMLIGLIVFWINQDKLENKGLVHKEFDTDKKFLGLSTNMTILIASLISIPIFSLLLGKNELFSKILLVVGVGIFGYLIFSGIKMSANGEKVSGQRIFVIVVLALFNIIFWALFEQAGGSLTIFAEKFVNRNIAGTEVPASVLQSFNALFIVLLAPVFAWLWQKLEALKADPNTPLKFVFGLVFLALGFWVIVLASNSFQDGTKVALVMLMVMYLFHTIGELCLSPIGLSMITKLSPGKMVGFMMGVWFLSFSLANNLGGIIGQFMAGGEAGSDGLSVMEQLNAYKDAYMNIGVYVVLAAAGLLLLLNPLLKKWMNGIH